MNIKAEIEDKKALVVAEAEGLVVVDKEGADEAASVGRQIKTLKSEIKGTFRPIIEKAHEAHKEALAQEKKYLEPLNKAESILKEKILKWQRAERERAEAIARAREAEERARLEAEAQKLAEEGDEDEALALLEESDNVVVREEAEKVSGAQVRRNMDVEVDIEQLVRAVAEGRAPMEFLAPNPAAIRAASRSMSESVFSQRFKDCGLRLYDKGSVAF